MVINVTTLSKNQKSLCDSLVSARKAHEKANALACASGTYNGNLLDVVDNTYVQMSQTQRIFDATYVCLSCERGTALLSMVDRLTKEQV